MISHILLNILAPILIMIALGAILRRKFALDMGTLSKLNIYLFLPAFIFQKVSQSALSWSEMGGLVGVSVLQVLLIGVVVLASGMALRINYQTLAAIALGSMFYNSGNFGLPLAELAWPSVGPMAEPGRDGGEVQAFVLMTQNVLTFTVGLTIAAWAKSGSVVDGLRTYLRLPIPYALAAALIARAWLQGDPSRALPILITKPAEYLSLGLVPVALITLGAQMASNWRWPRWRPLSMVMFLRLIYAPAQMAAMLWVFHWLGWAPFDLWGWPGDLLILTAAVPSAINTLLMTLELGGDADLAADCVFWTTVGSLVTVTAWLFILR